MMICGIAAIALYTLSWLMQLVELPGYRWMRLSAAIPFVIGGVILLYDRYKKSKAQERSSKGKNTGWEDILEDGEGDGEA
jgi:hypothetical protein